MCLGGRDIAKLLRIAIVNLVAGEGEDGGDVLVVNRRNSENLLSVGRRAGEEKTVVTIVTGRDSARNTSFDDAADGNSPRLFSPARGTANGSSDDLSAILKCLVVCSNQNIVTGLALAAKDSVSTKSDIGSATSEAVWVLLGGNDTSDVRTVTGAVLGIVVRHRGVETAVVVTDQVSTK
nr:hypothetical protein [Trichoderma harzianum]